ncbi:hypothetical protein KUTeg_001738 [Tegillarca granosa]|uniref:DIS3-like exonuclease 2 n=1 Tax=Tegillarca granosa TaxID=220873 RepID=A0ABQ9FSB2_TEGGR|nr:hypothetical protein KUTeg_001738 [Tegillarca granosa]
MRDIWFLKISTPFVYYHFGILSRLGTVTQYSTKAPDLRLVSRIIMSEEMRPDSGKIANDKDIVTSREKRQNSGRESAKKKGRNIADNDLNTGKNGDRKDNTKRKNDKGKSRGKQVTNNGENTPKSTDHRKIPKVLDQVFEPYWSLKDLSDGLKRGQLIKGPIRINPKNFEECFVPHPDGVSDIFINGMKDRNRAFNGDIVAVLLHSRDQWHVKTNNLDMYENDVKMVSTSGSSIEKEEQILTDDGQNEVKDRDNSSAIQALRSNEDGEESDPDIIIESEEEIDLVTGKSTKLNENNKKISNENNVDQAINLNPSTEKTGLEHSVVVNRIEEGVSNIALVGNETYESKIQRKSSQTSISSEVNSNKNGGNSAISTPKKKYTSLAEFLLEGSPAVKQLFSNEENNTKTDTNADKYLQRTGKVVGIVEPKHSRACSGNISFLSGNIGKYKVRFSPMDSRIPRILIPINDCPKDMVKPREHDNTLFIARITDWLDNSLMAHGTLMRSLGEAGEIEPETERILIENDVDYSEFPQKSLDSLPVQNLPWVIPEIEFSYRRDFRDVCVFTIDPSTARDLDDAVSIEKLKDGTYEVGVHIADVSHFLKEGTFLDSIASRRATSVYLVQKVIPMLPRILCEQLCSLNPDEDKLTFSVVWKMSDTGEIYEEWFGKSVINSCVKLSYSDAQGFIEEPDKVWKTEELPSIARFSIEDIKKRVLMLNQIAVRLRKKRFDGGALRLDKVKVQFSLDPETGLPNGYSTYEQKDSNRLIEEFMLLANMAVAHKINSTYPSLGLLRRHPAPQTRKVDELSALCESLGVPLNTSSSGSLQESLWTYCGDNEFSAARMQVLVNLCLKSMQNAVYFCNGSIEDEELYRHYALNVPLYTHFTSPIRRYADVMVHRQLAAALGITKKSKRNIVHIQKQAEQCNDKKRNSKIVQELSTELFFAVFVKAAGPFEEKAVVMGKLNLKGTSYNKEERQLTITWTATDTCKEEITQSITMFSVIDCVVQSNTKDSPLAWKVILKHPKDNTTS